MSARSLLGLCQSAFRCSSGPRTHRRAFSTTLRPPIKPRISPDLSLPRTESVEYKPAHARTSAPSTTTLRPPTKRDNAPPTAALQSPIRRVHKPLNTLTLPPTPITAFPTTPTSFRSLCSIPGVAFFDRTEYIAPLHTPTKLLLFLRPRRFGKSHTINMLSHFHGVQHKLSYPYLFKDLAVNIDVESGRIAPSRYLILRFDFSGVGRSADLNATAMRLGDVVVSGLREFWREYAGYWGKEVEEMVAEKARGGNPLTGLKELVRFVDASLNELQERGDETSPLAGVKGIYLLVDEYDAFNKEHLDSWDDTSAPAFMRNFWDNVKQATTKPFGILKGFITGTTPLSLNDEYRGFIFAMDMSFRKEFSGLCGVTHVDARAALEKICGRGREVEMHMAELDKWAGEYHFCSNKRVPGVYNTATCVEYLQSIVTKTPSTLHDPPTSEVPPSFLKLCLSSSTATEEIYNAISHTLSLNSYPIPRSQTINFNPNHLYNSTPDPSAWRHLLLYTGALTFGPPPDIPTNPPAPPTLRIPNQITTTRLGGALLDRYQIRADITPALTTLATTGNINPALSLYRRTMCIRDSDFNVFDWEEQKHVESFQACILSNPAVADASASYRVIAPPPDAGAGSNPRIDLLVSTPTHLVFTHWEVLGIEVFDFGKHQVSTRQRKQELLAGMGVEEILKLKFNDEWFGRRYKKRIKPSEKVGTWVCEEVFTWLKRYVKNRRIAMCGDRTFRACLVMVVGGRRLLVCELDREGVETGVKWLV